MQPSMPQTRRASDAQSRPSWVTAARGAVSNSPHFNPEPHTAPRTCGARGRSWTLCLPGGPETQTRRSNKQVSQIPSPRHTRVFLMDLQRPLVPVHPGPQTQEQTSGQSPTSMERRGKAEVRALHPQSLAASTSTQTVQLMGRASHWGGACRCRRTRGRPGGRACRSRDITSMPCWVGGRRAGSPWESHGEALRWSWGVQSLQPWEAGRVCPEARKHWPSPLRMPPPGHRAAGVGRVPPAAPSAHTPGPMTTASVHPVPQLRPHLQ